MMKKWFFSLILAFSLTYSYGQDRSDYIEQYKNIAVTEMMRTGIPASIKLAQAIHESNCGKSDLACKANNHFGIKCGNDWNGKTYKKEDDDYHEGELVKSCFREFRNPYDSYVAHSEFLTDPNKAKRYGFLFEIDPTDYKGWAKGLSKAGYATDPQYASRLIDIIEKYDLHQYDIIDDRQLAKSKKSHPPSSRVVELYKYFNDVKYAIAEEGDTPETFAARHDLSPKQLVKYNDDIDNTEQALVAGTRVYLQPKRSQFNGKQKTHLVKAGEDLVIISQQYGIKLESLLKRNGLEPGEIPAPNQKIVLKGKSEKKIRTINPYDVPEQISVPEPVVVSAQKPPQPKTVVVPEPKYQEAGMDMAVNSDPKSGINIHTVTKGDTLYSVATRYRLNVGELKKMNNLSADTIFIGQKLVIQ